MRKNDSYKNLEDKIRNLQGSVLNLPEKYQDDSNKDLRILDSLARLLKGTNKCTALFNNNGTMNVFYNPAALKANDNEFASHFFKHLTAINSSNDEALLELQMLNIRGLVHDLSKHISQIQSDPTPLHKVIIKLFDAVNEQFEDYTKELSQKLVEEHESKQDNTTTWNKYISCVFFKDRGAILSLYQECYTLASYNVHTPLAKKIIRNFKDFSKTVKYYETSAPEDIKFPEILDKNGEANTKLHAELQALEILSTDETKEIFIGISKLCCYPCFYIFQTFNEANNTSLVVRGTHGKIYLGWRFPENIHSAIFIKKNFLEKFQKILDKFDSYKADIFASDDPENSLSDIEVDVNNNLIISFAKQGEEFLEIN